MRTGDVIELTIEKGVFRGQGLGRHDGRVILLRGGYPGERWRARIREVARDFALADGEQLLTDVGVRRPSPCPHFPDCGGCVHQDLTYEAQLRLKRAVVEDALQRAGLEWPGEVVVRPSPESGWRTRVAFHLEQGRGETTLGFRAAASHRVVDIARCLHLGEAANRALDTMREAFAGRPALASRVQRIELAESGDERRRAIALDGDLRPKDVAATRDLLSDISTVDGAGVLVGAGARRRFVVAGGEVAVDGLVLGRRLQTHVLSFFQVNRFLVETLVEEVGRGLDQGGTLVDLYGGVGLFALAHARRFDAVVCVEGDPRAASDAELNVRDQGAAHVRVVHGDVARELATLARGRDEQVILDPPRSGAGRAVVRAVAAREPRRIVFVSCDPPTLARDLRQLVGAGYRVVGVTVLDMFPGTFHVETVVRLERAS